MNKFILNILIFTSILLIGIGAVSALDYNSTDNNLSIDENEVISIEENNSDVLNENIDDEIISADDNVESEILSQNNNSNEVAAVSDDSEVLSVENTSNEISTINDNSKVSSIQNEDKNILSKTETHYDAENGLNVTTETKKIYLPKIKVPYNKKYEKGIIPSKKNKKAWKKYKKYLKVQKKALKKWEKKSLKVVKKLIKQHWISNDDKDHFKMKVKGKKAIFTSYINCYRVYYFNPSTNTGWWLSPE